MPNFIAPTASIAELFHGEKLCTQSLIQLIWCARNRSFCFRICSIEIKYLNYNYNYTLTKFNQLQLHLCYVQIQYNYPSHCLLRMQHTKQKQSAYIFTALLLARLEMVIWLGLQSWLLTKAKSGIGVVLFPSSTAQFYAFCTVQMWNRNGIRIRVTIWSQG